MGSVWCLLLALLTCSGQASGIELPGRGGRQGGVLSKPSYGSDVSKELNPNRPNVTYVMIVPSTRFESVRRKYRSTINEALSSIKHGKVPGNHLNKHYALQVSVYKSHLCVPIPVPPQLTYPECTEGRSNLYPAVLMYTL